jgi:hypothetical protein
MYFTSQFNFPFQSIRHSLSHRSKYFRTAFELVVHHVPRERRDVQGAFVQSGTIHTHVELEFRNSEIEYRQGVAPFIRFKNIEFYICEIAWRIRIELSSEEGAVRILG